VNVRMRCVCCNTTQ